LSSSSPGPLRVDVIYRIARRTACLEELAALSDDARLRKWDETAGPILVQLLQRYHIDARTVKQWAKFTLTSGPRIATKDTNDPSGHSGDPHENLLQTAWGIW